jgi:hypothetical protein
LADRCNCSTGRRSRRPGCSRFQRSPAALKIDYLFTVDIKKGRKCR